MRRVDTEPSGWHRVAVSAPAALVGTVTGCCFELGSCGLEQRDEGSLTRLIAYFAAGEDLPSLLRRLDESLTRCGVDAMPLEVGRVDPEDWEVQWRRHFVPVQATPRIWVHPSWAPVDPGPGGIAVVIDPRMAFGTGGHESTQLSLQALEEHLWPGALCLDLGTGSGVLAIAAARLGAGRVLAVDLDPVAVANARDNLRLNGVVEDVVRVCQGSLEQAGEQCFDVVVANIQSQVLRPLLGPVAARLRPDGVAVFSGLLAAEEHSFRRSMEAAGLPPAPARQLRDWICLEGRRAA